MEAIGYGPDSEIIVESVNLAATDVHSGVQSEMRRNPNGLPVYSCERWLRLRFTSLSVQAALARFWISNLAPNPGWSMLMGTNMTYRKPTTSRSDIAVNPVPGVDPGSDLPNLYPAVTVNTVGIDDLLDGTIAQYSPWLVLQTIWTADNDDPFQADAFDFNFAWDEGQ